MHHRVCYAPVPSGYLNGYPHSNQTGNQNLVTCMVFRAKKHEKSRNRIYAGSARACASACLPKKIQQAVSWWPRLHLGVVCCMFPGRTENEILLLHAFCSKNLVCTCISIPYFRETFLNSYALFSIQLQISYSCMVTRLVTMRVTIQVTTSTYVPVPVYT